MSEGSVSTGGVLMPSPDADSRPVLSGPVPGTRPTGRTRARAGRRFGAAWFPAGIVPGGGSTVVSGLVH
ncbi:hypothetical protein [Streptomyces sp. enrichment culture]|uniref:hypothetical protein n=1 Tax=Streptomyces sp. enrichment culture TaxID=1795815 RepID=UPI003F571B69